MTTRTAKRPAVGRVRDALGVALLLTVGVTLWWWILPPDVLAGGGRTGPRQMLVTALLALPLALLAVGGAAWLARRRCWHNGGSWRVPAQAGATVGLLAVLLLATAPVQGAALDRWAPPAIEPNLAAIQYSDACPAIYTAAECRDLEVQMGTFDADAVAQAHHKMMNTTGHSAEASAAMNAPFDPNEKASLGADTVAYAVQDAFIVLLVGAPIAFLGLFLASRAPVPVPRRRIRPVGARSRWAAAGSALLLITVGNFVLSSAARAAVVPYSVPLRIPPVLQGAEVTLQMREADVQIMPTGPPTRMWTYNGIYPGPTIRRPSGQTSRISFRNDLPVTFDRATIHHHGSHSRPSEDGQPNDFLIPRGSVRTYTYEHLERGEPEWAVTQWYHDHRMDVTGRNVWNGLAGMFILDDAFDSALPLPKGEFDVPLVIADKTFDANNQIPYTFSIVGTLGDTWLVNGRPQPYFDVGDRKYRVRILNAANRRPLVLALSNGAPMTQIGTDAGLLPAPIQRTSIILQPAERVEVVLDFAGLLGQNVVLMDTNTPATPGNPPKELMQFRVNRDLTETSSVPATLRPAPTFPTPTKDRQFVLRAVTNAAGTPTQWTINNQAFDPNRIDADPVLNSTERWTFMNVSPQPHSIHLHDVDWQLVSRFQVVLDASGNPTQGAAIPVQPYESALKETFFIPANTGFSVLTTFTDHLGPYMLHCHMLEHEDMAMMARFVVKAS
ncbi:multicopper oxidase family protein [Phytohabitans rumicis]|uniref:multicopper oxidase family protein n=1 Tax=Phytohabitans rumicis TaxID=1076125 RepID=UPI0031EE7D5A